MSDKSKNHMKNFKITVYDENSNSYLVRFDKLEPIEINNEIPGISNKRELLNETADEIDTSLRSCKRCELILDLLTREKVVRKKYSKAPISGWLLYRRFVAAKEENQGLKGSEVVKIASQSWKDKSIKDYWNAQAIRLKNADVSMDQIKSFIKKAS